MHANASGSPRGRLPSRLRGLYKSNQDRESAFGGRHMQLRVDFRMYMTPLPDEVIQPVGLLTIDRWVFDFVPLGGISFVF
jgi:hypothetical protein